MTMDDSIEGKVVFTMFGFLEDVIMEEPHDLKTNRSQYPGIYNLFKVEGNSTEINKDKAELLNRLVARLPFASK